MEICKAINGVMDEIGAVGKTSKNQQQGFMYRGIDAVMNALQPALIKHKIFVCPEVLEQTREERTTKSGSNILYSILKMKYTFYAADGSSVSVVVIGEGMDSGDKASNKAMSIAFKYACFQVFCIPTEEMKDPDADTPPPSTRVVEFITPSQLAELTEFKVNEEKLCEAYGVDCMEQLTKAQAADAITKKRLQAKKEAGAVNLTSK